MFWLWIIIIIFFKKKQKILAQSQTAELATVEVFEHLNPSQRGMMVNAAVGGCTKQLILNSERLHFG